jgi:hydroxyacylglutathione hydrolase
MIVRQLEVGFMDNFSYLVGCETSRQAMVIDPAGDAQEIVALAGSLGLTIVLIVNTHGHGDHTAGNAGLKALTGAQIVIHELDADGYPSADRRLSDETSLQLGDISFDVLHTPGHTPGGICLYAEGHLFTGDTLFVGDSGRTDLKGGHRPTLGASIRRLMRLPEETIVWPGHDYGPTPSSTLGWEKRHNVNAREYGYHIPS